jgi:outer membrane lipoprotein-sorting protein
VWVVESVPKEQYKGFVRKVSYIDQETSLPLKEEYFDKKDKLVRQFRAESIEMIDSIPTITKRSIENVKKGQHTIVEFSSIDYNVGVEKSLFTERYLKNPPREILR